MEALANERQALITWARIGRITTTDMEQQLSAMTLQEWSIWQICRSVQLAVIPTFNEEAT
jgi:hypothetical protein